MSGAEARQIDVPKELEAALRHARLWGVFESLPPSHRREHADFVAEAKKAETRARRAERCVGMIEADHIETGSKPIIVRLD